MPNTVFWSWQSDRSSRETRDIFRDALTAAIDRVAAELDEAERPELDHDTRNVPGVPDIVATIFEKIDEAAVFVADVTPVAVSDEGKHLANPNVLIELGYAKKALGTEKIVLVWNTAFTGARPEDLPFDMRHRRAPISISLPMGSPTADLRKVRRSLTDVLEEALRGSLGAQTAGSSGRNRSRAALRYGPYEPTVILSALNDKALVITELSADVRKFEPLTSDQLDEFIARVEKISPIETDFGSPETTPQPRYPDSRVISIEYVPVSDVEVAAYQERYSDWISECRKMLERLHQAAKAREPNPRITISAENRGSRPAASVWIVFRSSLDLAIRPVEKDDEGEQATVAGAGIEALPDPPVAPRGRWVRQGQSASSKSIARNFDFLADPWPTVDAHRLAALGRPPAPDPDAFYWKDGRPAVPKEEVSLTCQNWRHGIGPKTFKFEVLATEDQPVITGQISCEVHAENLSEPASMFVPVTIVKVITPTNDLAENLVKSLGRRLDRSSMSGLKLPQFKKRSQ